MVGLSVPTTREHTYACPGGRQCPKSGPELAKGPPGLTSRVSRATDQPEKRQGCSTLVCQGGAGMVATNVSMPGARAELLLSFLSVVIEHRKLQRSWQLVKHSQLNVHFLLHFISFTFLTLLSFTFCIVVSMAVSMMPSSSTAKVLGSRKQWPWTCLQPERLKPWRGSKGTVRGC